MHEFIPYDYHYSFNIGIFYFLVIMVCCIYKPIRRRKT